MSAAAVRLAVSKKMELGMLPLASSVLAESSASAPAVADNYKKVGIELGDVFLLEFDCCVDLGMNFGLCL